MGQNNFKSNDFRGTLPLNWQQCPNDSNILINRLTQQHLQRHHIKILIKDLPRQTTLLSARISNPHPNVCRLYYYHLVGTQPRGGGDPQKDSRDIYVYTDHMLPLRKDDWTKQKIIHAMQALKRLTIIYGPFYITEQMICQNELGDIRIWINNNPGLNHINYSCENEEQSFATLITLLMHKNKDLANTLRGCRLLRDALEKLERQANSTTTPYQRLSHQAQDNDFFQNRQFDSNKGNPVNYGNQTQQVNRVSPLKIYQNQFSHLSSNCSRQLLKSQSNLSNLIEFKNKLHNFPESKTPKGQKVSYKLPYQIPIDQHSSLKFAEKTAIMANLRNNTTVYSQQQKMKNYASKVHPFIHPNSNDSGEIFNNYPQQSAAMVNNNSTFPSSKLRSYATPVTNTPCRFSYKQVTPNQTPTNNLSSFAHSTHNYLQSPSGLQSPIKNNSYFQKVAQLQHCPTAPNKSKFLNQTEGNEQSKNQPNKVPIFIKNMKKKTTTKNNKQFQVIQNTNISSDTNKGNSFSRLQIKPQQENGQEDMNKSTKESFVSGQPYHSRPDSHRKPQKLYTFCNVQPAHHNNDQTTKNRSNQFPVSPSKPIMSKSPFKQKSNTSSRPNLNVPKSILGHVPSISFFQGINKSQKSQIKKQKALNRTKTSELSNKTKIASHFESITFRNQQEVIHPKTPVIQSNKQISAEQIPTTQSIQMVTSPIKQIQQQEKQTLKKQLKLQFQSLLGEEEKTLMTHLNSKEKSTKPKPTDEKTQKKELKDKIKMKQLEFAELKKQALMVLTDD